MFKLFTRQIPNKRTKMAKNGIKTVDVTVGSTQNVLFNMSLNQAAKENTQNSCLFRGHRALPTQYQWKHGTETMQAGSQNYGNQASMKCQALNNDKPACGHHSAN